MKKELETMRRLLGAGLLLAFAVVVAPEAVYAQKEKPEPPDPKAPVDSAKLNAGEYFGKLKSVPGTDRNFIITIDIQTLAPNGAGARPPAYRPNLSRPNTGNATAAYNSAIQQLNRLQQQYNQAQQQYLAARRPQQRQQALSRMQSLQSQINNQVMQANNALSRAQLQSTGGLGGLGGMPGGIPPGYKVVNTPRDVEFQAKEDVKARTLVLPEEFDDKGNVKKYTKEELSEMRGKGPDRKLPGYEFSTEKLEVGQIVKVVLVTMPKKKAVKDKDKEDKDKDKEKDAVDEDEKKKQVRLIIVLKGVEDASPGTPGKGKRRKKDD